MKKIDNMTKEELKEAIKELKKEIKEMEKGDNENMLDKLLEKMKENNKKEYENSDKEVRDNFEKLYDGSKCICIISNIGSMCFGLKQDIMSCISMMISKLIDEGLLTKIDFEAMITTIKKFSNFKETDNEELEKQFVEMLNKLFD